MFDPRKLHTCLNQRKFMGILLAYYLFIQKKKYRNIFSVIVGNIIIELFRLRKF